MYAQFLAIIRHKVSRQDGEAVSAAEKASDGAGKYTPAQFVPEFVQKWLAGGLTSNLRNLNWLRLKNWLRLCASFVAVGILERSEVVALLQGLIGK